MGKIQLYPQRKNVGKNGITPEFFNEHLAKKLVKTKLWGYTPSVNTKEDIELIALEAKRENAQERNEIELERERLIKEREELEILRAELLTSSKKLGRPKAEV